MRLRVPVKRLKLSSLLCFTIKFTTIYYFKGIGGHGITDLLRNAIDDLLDTISSRETYRSAEHRMYAQMNRLTEAGAMISLAIELITSNIRRNYGEINFERYPRPVEVEGEDKH